MKTPRTQWKWDDKSKTKRILFQGDKILAIVRQLTPVEEKEARPSMGDSLAPIWRWEVCGTSRWGMSFRREECERIARDTAKK